MTRQWLIASLMVVGCAEQLDRHEYQQKSGAIDFKEEDISVEVPDTAPDTSPDTSYDAEDTLCGQSCDDGDACTYDSCEPLTGQCKHVPKTCDDAVFCTLDSCNPADGSCAYAPDDLLCLDGDVCDGQEMCDASVGCVDGTPITCDDGVACTTDECLEGGCMHTPDHNACDDADLCDYEECDATMGCVGLGDVDCDDGKGCTKDACDPDTGECSSTPDHALCDDGSVCTIDDVCDPETGDCSYPTNLDCTDGHECTVDTCDPTIGCDPTPLHHLCADDDKCNGDEVCTSMGCKPGTPVDCDDGVACTKDSCHPFLGGCIHETDDSVCQDDLYCDAAEICNPQQGCVEGSVPNCDDFTECTDDYCSEEDLGCVNAADDSVCDDGDICTGKEWCEVGVGCNPGVEPNCNDGVACTDDGCSKEGDTPGCYHTPNKAHCPDDDVCNGEDYCDPKDGCKAGPKADCDDGVDCTLDKCDKQCIHTPKATECAIDDKDCTETKCDPTDGCVHIPNDAECDDGDLCNGVEKCAENQEDCDKGQPKVCDDKRVCTVDSCSMSEQSCEFTFDRDKCVCDAGLLKSHKQGLTFELMKTKGVIPMVGVEWSLEMGMTGEVEVVPPTCKTDCVGEKKASAAITGSLEVTVPLQKPVTGKAEGTAAGNIKDRQCKECTEDDCKEVCVGEACQSVILNGKGKLSVERFFGFSQATEFANNAATLECGALGALSLEVDLEYSETEDKGITCGDCDECTSKQATVTGGLKATLNCGVKGNIDLFGWKWPFHVGCKSCGHLEIAAYGGGGTTSGAKCENKETCGYVGFSAKANANTGCRGIRTRWFRITGACHAEAKGCGETSNCESCQKCEDCETSGGDAWCETGC